VKLERDDILAPDAERAYHGQVHFDFVYNHGMTETSARKIAPVVTKFRYGDKKNDAAYWRGLSYQERIEALEQIREEYHQWKADAQPGFQRVFTIIKR
jgi:hypothetical protein